MKALFKKIVTCSLLVSFSSAQLLADVAERPLVSRLKELSGELPSHNVQDGLVAE